MEVCLFAPLLNTNASLLNASLPPSRLTSFWLDVTPPALGKLTVLSALGQPLRAEIEALKAPKPILRVPTAALLIVVERRKLMAQLDAIRAALPEGQQREFDLYLRFPETRRDHPLVAIVQQAFGWTDAEVDALFVEADAV